MGIKKKMLWIDYSYVTSWHTIYKNLKQKNHTCMQTLKDIQCLNSNYWWSNALIISHLCDTNVLTQKSSKIVFNKTIDPTFNFEVTNVHHHSCPSSYKFLEDQTKLCVCILQFISHKIY